MFPELLPPTWAPVTISSGVPSPSPIPAAS